METIVYIEAPQIEVVHDGYRHGWKVEQHWTVTGEHARILGVDGPAEVIITAEQSSPTTIFYVIFEEEFLNAANIPSFPFSLSFYDIHFRDMKSSVLIMGGTSQAQQAKGSVRITRCTFSCMASAGQYDIFHFVSMSGGLQLFISHSAFRHCTSRAVYSISGKDHDIMIDSVIMEENSLVQSIPFPTLGSVMQYVTTLFANLLGICI